MLTLICVGDAGSTSVLMVVSRIGGMGGAAIGMMAAFLPRPLLWPCSNPHHSHDDNNR